VTQITGLSDGRHRLRVIDCCKVSPCDCNYRNYSEYDKFSKYIMDLMPASEKFVAWWGEMGSKWGVNRTVAEIHALFYLSQDPLNAEDLAATLSFSRSNVSASLRELQNWGLISPVHFRGDRKQYYEAIKDPWEMFRVILDERRRREIDPAVATLRTCVQEAAGSTPDAPYIQERLRSMLEFFEVMIPIYDELRRIPPASVHRIAKLTAKVREVVG
jgi:DNA-binding transcriptional regulator GbsR (MarR family)